MIAYKLIAIFFSLLLLLQAYVIKLTSGSFLVPGSLFSFAWFLFTFVPLVLLFNVPVNPGSILYIFILVFAFAFSAVPFNWKFAFLQNEAKDRLASLKFDSAFIRVCFYVSVGSSFLFCFLFVLSNGFDIASFLFDFIGTSARYAALRGNEYLEYGLLGTLSIFFTYFSAVLGGIVTYFIKTGRRKILWFGLSIAPSLFAMLTQSSKLIFMVAVIFYLSSTFLMKIHAGNRSLVRFSDLLKSFWLSLLLIPLLIIAFISREGYNNFDTYSEAFDLLLPAINSYLFGSLYAFADFFSFYMGFDSSSVYQVEDGYTLGYYSFKSIFDTFGGTKIFPPGYYSDNYSYGNVLATNIFSFFRQLIQDFGCLGSIIVMYVFGIFNHYFFYKMLVRNNAWFASCVFIVFFAFLGFSFLLNIFTARYIFLIAFSLYVVLNINSWAYGKGSLK